MSRLNELLTPRGIQAEFEAALAQMNALSTLGMVCELTSSDSSGETYPILGANPTLELFQGKPKVQQYNTGKIIVLNDEYQVAIELKDQDIRRDRHGMLLKRAGSFAAAQDIHSFELRTQLILDGESGISHDGVAYFSTSHSWGKSGTQSNLDTYDISGLSVSSHGADKDAPSVQEAAYILGDVASKLMHYKNDQSKYAYIMRRKFLVEVPRKYFQVFNAAAGSLVFGGGESNPLANLKAMGVEFDVRVNPYFTVSLPDSVVVYAADEMGEKALIFQSEELAGANQSGVAIEVLGPGSEYWRLNHKSIVNAWASRGVGYNQPLSAFKATLT